MRAPDGDDVRAAYDAPFPDEALQGGPAGHADAGADRPGRPGDRREPGRLAALTGFERPFLVAFSDGDPITGAMAPVLRRAVPGAAGRTHPVIEDAGHFLQEDAGERLGGVVADLVRSLDR